MRNKVVFITGASGGIGYEIAKRFANKNYAVLFTYCNNAVSAKQLESELKKMGIICEAFKCDITNSNEVQETVEIIKQKYRFVDVLINNAGKALFKMFDETTDLKWSEQFNVNLMGHIRVTREILPLMISQQHGKIVNISSMWGVVGAALESAYSTFKGGLNALTKALAKELAPNNINVNAVACGMIDTPMNDELDEEEKKEFISGIPLKRQGKPSEVAALVEFLSSDLADYITGQIVNINGGLF